MELDKRSRKNKLKMKHDIHEAINKSNGRRRRIFKTKRKSSKKGYKLETTTSFNSDDVLVSDCQKRKSSLAVKLRPTMSYAKEIMGRLRKTSQQQINRIKFDQSKRYTLLRFNIINRLFKQQKELQLTIETVFMAIYIFDTFLAKKKGILFSLSKYLSSLDKKTFSKVLRDLTPFSVNEIKPIDILAVLSLFIACKYQEVYPPSLQEFAEFSASDIKLLVSEEQVILETLDYCIKPTTEVSVFNFVKNEVAVGEAAEDSIFRRLKLGIVSGEIRNGYTIDIIFGLFRLRVINKEQLTEVENCYAKYNIDEELAITKATEFLKRADQFKKFISTTLL